LHVLANTIKPIQLNGLYCSLSCSYKKPDNNQSEMVDTYHGILRELMAYQGMKRSYTWTICMMVMKKELSQLVCMPVVLVVGLQMRERANAGNLLADDVTLASTGGSHNNPQAP
jgi:hypothetical protein